MKDPAATLRLLAVAGAIAASVMTPQLARAQAGSSLPDPAVPCDAFQRFGAGSWEATRPVTLNFGEAAMTVAPGDTFPVGTTQNGVALPVILDRQCGNQ